MEKAWLYGSWYGHQKSLGLPLSAKGMWLDCFAWSIAQDTEGFIPTKVVRSVAGWGEGTEGRNLADLLVDAGLWEEVTGGYQMHNWCDRQPAADAILRRREQTKTRMRRLRERQQTDATDLDQDAPDHVTRHSDARDAPRGEERREDKSQSNGKETTSLPPTATESTEPTRAALSSHNGKGETHKTNAKPKRYTPQSDALTRELWDRLDPKPMCGFVAVRQRISEALAAGYTSESLRRATPHIAVWSRSGIEIAFRKAGIDPKLGASAEGASRDADLRLVEQFRSAWQYHHRFYRDTDGTLPVCHIPDMAVLPQRDTRQWALIVGAMRLVNADHLSDGIPQPLHAAIEAFMVDRKAREAGWDVDMFCRDAARWVNKGAYVPGFPR
jgi:hypothetical protein